MHNLYSSNFMAKNNTTNQNTNFYVVTLEMYTSKHLVAIDTFFK